MQKEYPNNFPQILDTNSDNHYYEKFEDGTINDITEEIPFEIPDSWKFIRFKYLVNYKMGKTPPRGESQFWNNDYNWISIADMIDGEVIHTTKEKISNLALNQIFNNNFSPSGTLIMSFKLSVGKVSILGIDAVHNEAIISIFPFYDKNNILRDYLFNILPLISKNGDSKKAIKGNTLNSTSIGNLLIPITSLDEIKRINTKIKELKLSILVFEEKNNKVNLLNNNYKEELKKSILQYAIQGKLVKQNPNDEPAQKLIEKILDEKRQLIKEKKIKKENLSVIYKDPSDNQFYEKFDDGKINKIESDLLFEIPNNWCYVRLGNIVEIARGGSPRPIKDYLTTDTNGLNWIKIGDTEKGSKYINSTKEKINQNGLYKTRFVHKGDFILSNSMSFGRPYILNIDGCIHDGWLVLSNIEKAFNKDFLYYLLSSNFIYNQFCNKVSGAVVNNLNSDKVKETIVPIPPKNEQLRIITKLEKILTIIETAE